MLPKFVMQAKENLVEKPWGGEWIALLKGFRKKGIAESWEFSAHPLNPSEVLVKEEIMKLSDFVARFREQVLGELSSKYSGFPILLKIVEAENMPIIVHPSPKTAESLNETETAKFKAWLVISGTAFIGFSEDISEELLDSEDLLLEKMNKFKATQFDTFVIPWGMAHTARNARFVEISTNSELTYKLGDEKFKKAVNLSKTEEYEVRGKKGRIETEFFFAEILEVSGNLEISINTFEILLCLDGYAILKSEREIVELHKGYSCLIPAATKSYSIQSGGAKILRVVPR